MDTNQELKKGIVKDGLYVGNVALIMTDQRSTEPSNFRETDDKGRDLADGNREWIEWGTNDDYPDQVEEMNSQEPVSSRCLEFKEKAVVGQGLFWYRKVFENGREFHDPVDINSTEMSAIREFCDRSNIDQVLQTLSLDVAWWNFCHTELIKNKAGNKFLSMHRLDTAYCRVSPMNARGRSEKVYISSRFGQKRPSDRDIQTLNLIDPADPFKFDKAVYRSMKPSPRRLYYPKSSWHSIFGALDLSLQAFTWIRANLNNSQNIKYLVKVPWNYFLSRFRQEDYKTRELWLAAIEEDEKRLYKEIDDVLAGAENAMKTFKTKYGKMEDGEPIDEFKIEPLKVDTQHQAWLPLYDTTTAAICSGHGVAPPLASIQVSSSMGASHGSTIRELFNFYTQFETTIPRQVVLESLNFVKRANRWPFDIYPGFRNIILDTLDHSRSGTRTEGEGNPTTTNKES